MDIDSELLAAIDLGSNSFHMVVAREEHGELRMLDKEKEMVRLGAGLQKDGSLSEEVQERAIDCLTRFSQRLREIGPGRLRAVGTNTLRAAHDKKFLQRAEEALGHHISIISGIEEARLVYLGAAHSLAQLSEQRLVVDIGGGSTELIIGHEYEPIQMDSLFMGCVSYSRKFFKNEKFSRNNFNRAITAALVELEPVMRRYKQMGWSEAVGTSGTIRSIDQVVAAEGWSEEGISRKSLNKLIDAIVERGSVDTLQGLTERRVPVFAGGLAVLKAVFDSLEIDRMLVANGALREGVLWDLLGRLQDQDIRERSVAALSTRSGTDQEQAQRVQETALRLLQQVAGAWGLLEPRMQRILRWAAQLHETGMMVSYNQYHKHGAYILRNANLSGFSSQQQQVIAALVRTHRRKFNTSEFKTLPKRWRDSAKRLALILRLAVALNRGRSNDTMVEPQLIVDDKELLLRLPQQWLKEHPLTQADLVTERAYLNKAGFEFEIEEIA